MYTVYYLVLKYEPLKLANHPSNIQDLNASQYLINRHSRKPLYLVMQTCDGHMSEIPGAC